MLGEEDLLIEQAKVDGFVAQSYGGYSVALDVRLTEELIAEGFVREVVSKVQTMRKDADFNVTDHIVLTAEGSEKVLGYMKAGEDTIRHDCLADDIVFGAPEGSVKEWNVNGEKVRFGVKVVG